MTEDNEPLPAIFEMSEADLGKLSVNWLEYYAGQELEAAIQLVLNDMSADRTIRRGHFLLKLNVENTKEKVFENLSGNFRLNFIEDVYPGNPSHAAITGYSVGDGIVALEICNSVLEKIPLTAYTLS